MCIFKIIIEKGNVADNAKAVGENGKLVSIAEMAVDVLLFGIGTGSGLRGHKSVGHLVRVNIGIVFIVRFEAADEGVKGFGVIFRDIKFNAGGIESKDLSKGAVDGLADRFSEVNHALEHQFDIRKKVLFKACEEGSVRHLGETAEIP